jgi:putative ABC transport system ATP-binding protein
MNAPARRIIALRDVYKIYGSGDTEVRALNGVNLDIDEGDFVAVMGSSGSGKSTCMNMLGCLDTPTHGAYRFYDVEVGDLSHDERALLRRHYIGFVFQSFNLLARTSAVENVELPLIYKGVPRKQRRDLALDALDRVGLADRFDHTPAQLSGGQQQRVAIARAIVTAPAFLVADEPTGNLDSARSVEIMRLLQGLNADGITIIMVTHEPDIAAFARRVLIFRDGLITQDGTPREVLS